jgi:hypothetical protein
MPEPQAARTPRTSRLKVIAGFLSAAVLAAVTAQITGLTERTIAAVVDRTHPSAPLTITGERPEPLPTPPPPDDSARSARAPSGMRQAAKEAGGTKRPPMHVDATHQLIQDGSYGSRREYAGLVVARAASAIRPPADDVTAEGLDNWIRRYDAADPDETQYTFVVQGKPGRTVMVNRIRLVYSGRAAAPAVATVVTKNFDGAGGVAAAMRYFTADLDSPSGRLRPDPGTPDFPFRVSNDDPEAFYLTATTRGCDCHWRILVDWASDGRSGTLPIDETFHTTPRRHYPELTWGPTFAPPGGAGG